MKLQLLATLLLGLSTAWAEQPTAAPIRFGSVLFLSGDYAQAGNAFREGVDLAAQEANSSGGIAGRQVIVVHEDTGYEQRRAVSGARKLTSIDHVAGTVISTLHEAKTAGPIFEKAKIPAIVLWDSSHELDEMGRYIFGIGTWAPSTTDAAVNFALKDIGAKKAAIVHSNTEWAQTVADEFQRKYIAAGGTVTGVVSLNPGQVDFRAEIVRLRGFKPDLLYAPVDDNFAAFFRQLRQLSFPAPVITADNLTEAIIGEDPAAFEAVYQTQVADPDSLASHRLAELYRKQFGGPPKMLAFTAWGYDGMRLLIEQAQTCGAEPEKITECLYQLRGFEGASGPIAFNAGGSSPKPVSMFQVRGGKLVRVQEIE